jgi:F-type H+-transporting ATPase subunit epsilon
MATLRLEIVTAERMTYAGEVDIVIAPGIVGQLAILPHHAPLMTMLEPGELCIRKGGEENFIAISGGFLEVLARAAAAKERAQQGLKSSVSEVDHARAEAALRRSLARLKVAERRRRKEKRIP